MLSVLVKTDKRLLWLCPERILRVVFFFILNFAGVRARLINGTNSSSGVVEVSHSGAWARLCHGDANWEINSASALCKQLGYPGALSVYSVPTTRHANGGKNWIDSITCPNNATDLTMCIVTNRTRDSCPSGQEVAVTCNDREYNAKEKNVTDDFFHKIGRR